MLQAEPDMQKIKTANWKKGLLFCLMGIVLNLIGAQAAIWLNLPLYLDNVGTVLSGAVGGYVPGIIVGYLTNLINGIGSHDTIYYGVLTVIIAVSAAWFDHHGWFKKWYTVVLSILWFALIGGGLGSVLTWYIYGMEYGQGISAGLFQTVDSWGLFSKFGAQVTADFLLDIADKAIVTVIALVIMHFISADTRRKLRLRAWQQKPLQGEERRAVKRAKTRGISLRSKIMILVSVVMVIIAIVTISVSFTMFRQSLIDAQVNMAHGVANVIASSFDPDQVDVYLTEKDGAAGYFEAEQTMIHVRDSSPDIQYVYVYQILEDGCHVIFDPDTEELPGSDPGDVIPFDDAFQKYVPSLLRGEEIEPVISDETYGWLLTVYQPVQNSRGQCVCYAGVDISMEQLMKGVYSYLAKALSLFVAFFVLIVTVGLWLAEYGIVMPVNSMALATSGFAYDSDAQRQQTVEHLKGLDIRTGDEIENLYRAITKTSVDTVQYIADVQQKNETIAHMQDNLITVLADMVESRDQYTGNHVKNTAAYSGIIARQLRREGYYTDQLTDDFIRDLVHSAPLHDVGKIQVSDTLLNKPGRLTDDEFAKMKHHTIAGKEIIAKAAEMSDDSTYLEEAENLAAYHHERWDGKGYPYGLAGEEIPLSARIMAVADVFDALVSKRSYKEGFSVEKSLSIIREGMGTHFDPKVAQAFLDAEDEVIKIVEMNRKTQSV